jgi:hypothetical protein
LAEEFEGVMVGSQDKYTMRLTLSTAFVLLYLMEVQHSTSFLLPLIYWQSKTPLML